MRWPPLIIERGCERTAQCDPRNAADEYFEYIDIAGIDRDQKIISSTTRTFGSEAPSRARKKVQTGDVLVSTVRPNLNAVAMVPQHLDGQIASTGFCVLRANRETLNHRYLFFYTQTSRFVSDLMTHVRGANYPAVTDRNVRETAIPLPPLSEQRKIVELLDQADALRKRRAAADQKAERILPAIFYKMFGDPATNSMGFQKKRLGDLIKVKSGNFLPAKEMDAEGSFPVYGGNGINGHHSAFMFEEQKIVIGRVGVYCGVVHYSQPNCWVTDNALYVSEKDDELLDSYLSEALRMANLNQYAGRAGQPLISGSRIYPIKILLPPVSVQKSFEASLAALNVLNENRKKACERIRDIFTTILHRAFSGELTAKWREAHMQELLREMAIQARELGLEEVAS